VLWLPDDLAPRAEARPDSDPEPVASYVKLVAAESGLVITLNVSELMADELLKTAFQEVIKEIDQSIRVPLADVDRATFALVRGEFVRIVQTRKPYDRDKMQDAFTRDRFKGEFKDGFKDDKDGKDKDGKPKREEVLEKKVAGKVIYY